MGHAPNKARKLEDDARRRDSDGRRRDGWTVFHFDFRPQQTTRNLYLGEAARHLQKVTGHQIGFWRCPKRGLAIEYKRFATATPGDRAERYRVLRFSRLEDEKEAKRELVEDMLLNGLGQYRGLPNVEFDKEVDLLKSLLRARPAVGADQWLRMKRQLQPKSQEALETRQEELRAFLLGQSYDGDQVGPVAYALRLVVGNDD